MLVAEEKEKEHAAHADAFRCVRGRISVKQIQCRRVADDAGRDRQLPDFKRADGHLCVHLIGGPPLRQPVVSRRDDRPVVQGSDVDRYAVGAAYDSGHAAGSLRR